jgi:Leucine-rich repeat (LRR) protein
MKITRKPLYIVVLLIAVLVLSSCSKNAENEHLPEYCQTYSSFIDVASSDLFDLIYEQGEDQEYITRYNYLSVIATNKLEFDVDDPNREIDLGGIQCFQNLTSLTLRGRSFKDISEISALSNIQSLVLENTSVVSIDSFKNLSKINSLSITGTKTLQSVDGVGEMTKLTTLDLSDNGLVNIGELNALVNLENLYLNNNEIVIFPDIYNLGKLENMDISNNSIIQLGEDLSGLSALRVLDAANNEICDLSTLDDLNNLVTLDLGFNDLGCGGVGVSPNFDSLENAPNLRTLILNDNNLTSIEGLRDRNISLETLYINNNNLTDLTPIGEYTNITTLLIDNNNIVNIDNLSGMTGLTSIDLSYNSIVDFSDLLTIENLETIYLGFNQIDEIPDISTSWTSLKYLDLQSNVLTDTSGVNGHPSLEIINLYNNGLTELSGISNMPELVGLIIFEEDLEDLTENDIGAYDVELLEVDILDENPNAISTITDSFNNLPELLLHDANVFDFGFPVEDNLEIYNSIQGLELIATVDFSGMNIDFIDEFSIQLPNLTSLRVEENNITEIGFILGNPNLVQINLSENNIGNLEVISGLTTDDLDNVTDIIADDIPSDNNLVDAFIDLPSLENVSLSGTSIVSLDNCFNGLVSLELLVIDSFNLESIENSFNNIFGTYEDSNVFNFDEGKIGEIRNSFNGGSYEWIAIQGQTPVIGATVIEDSFNNITTAHNNGLVIQASNFVTISGSFNTIDTYQLLLDHNDTETLTTSFVGSTIETVLGLNNNKLETVPSLNQLTLVDEVKLNNNYLSTLSFIDSVTGMTTLDITSQRNPDLLVYTLASFDGVNNQPLLTSMSYDQIGVTAIDGLQNTGLVSLDFSFTQNNNIPVLTVSPTSFTGTDLDELFLDDHALSDISFLDNLAGLETLHIGIDLADLSDFQAKGFEAGLTILSIDSSQDVSDFSYLADYDAVTDLTITGLSVETINNLDGLDSLIDLVIPKDQITSISNSFNTLDVIEPTDMTETYLEDFNLLLSVTNSFDLYGTESHPNNVIIDGDYTIVDSFNNATAITIENNLGDATPTFDTDSFDSMTSISLEYGDYTSYTFLNGYTTLNTVVIDDLSLTVDDISNDNITSFTILDAASTIDTFTIDINTSGVFNLVSSRLSTLTVNGDMGEINVTATNSNVVLNSTGTNIILAGEMEDYTLNSATVATISFDTFESDTITLNTDALTSVTRIVTFPTLATTMNINSDQASLSIDVRAEDVIITNDTATTYNLSVDPGGTNTGNVAINSVQPDLVIDFTGEDLSVSYNTLESLDITGDFSTLSTNSDVLDTVDLNTAAVEDVIVTSDSTILDVISSTATNVSLVNNSIETLTLNLPTADTTLTTTNNQSLVINANSDNLDIVGGNIPDITLDNASSISNMQLIGTSTISTFDYGSATLGTLDFTSTQASITINGTTASTISVDGVTYTDLVFNAPLSDFTVADLGVTVNLNANAGDINLEGTSFATLTVNAASTIGTVTIDNSNSFATFNSNDVTMTLVDITTQTATMNVDVANVTNTTIDNLNVSSLTIDSGSNNASLNSQGLGSISADVTADTFTVSANTDQLTIDNASNISTLNVSSQNLTDIIAGTATIGAINVTQSALGLDVSGTSIAALDINANVNTLVVNTGAATDLVVSTASNTTFNGTVSTSSIELNSGVDATINGVNLDDVDLNVGSADVTIDADMATLNLTITGTANEVTVTGDDVDGLIFDGTTNLNRLIITDLDVTTLDLSAGTIDNIEISTTETSFNLTGNDLTEAILDGDNLNNVTVNSTNPNTLLTLSSTQAAMDLNGNIDGIEFTNNTLTSINIDDVTVNDLTLNTNSLSAFNSGTSISNTLDITTTQNNFNLTSNVPIITFDGGAANTFDLTSTLVGTLQLNATIDTINITAGSTDLVVVAGDLNAINGTMNDLQLNTVDTGTFTLDVTANDVIFENSDATTLNVIGVNTMNSLDIISGSITTVDTNQVDITTFTYNANNNTTNITTESSTINLSSTGTGDVTLTAESSNPITLDLVDTKDIDITVSTATDLTVTGNGTGIVVNSDTITDLTVNTALILTLEYNYAANDTTINTQVDSVDLVSSASGNATLTYSGVGVLSLVLDSLNAASVTLSTASSLDVEGTLTDLTVIGTAIDTVATDLLTVNNKFTMDGTLVTDLEFVSTALLANVNEIEMDSLTTGNIGSILTKLDGSTITLTTTITDLDVYNYHYNSQVTVLTDQEAIDTVRYDGFRSDAVDAAWAKILENSYMAHLDETVTKAEIDAQTYQTVEDYFQSYLTEIGQTEVQLGATESTNARNAITATLADPLLTIVELTLQGQVTTSIEEDADTYALAEQAAQTFTIAN